MMMKTANRKHARSAKRVFASQMTERKNTLRGASVFLRAVFHLCFLRLRSENTLAPVFSLMLIMMWR